MGIPRQYCIKSRGGIFKETADPGRYEFLCPSCVSGSAMYVDIPDIIGHQLSDRPLGLRCPVSRAARLQKFKDGRVHNIKNIIKISVHGIRKSCNVEDLDAFETVECFRCLKTRFERNYYTMCWICSAHLYTMRKNY